MMETLYINQLNVCVLIHHCSPFVSSTSQTTEILELVHSDAYVCGKMQEKSLGGGEYSSPLLMINPGTPGYTSWNQRIRCLIVSSHGRHSLKNNVNESWELSGQTMEASTHQTDSSHTLKMKEFDTSKPFLRRHNKTEVQQDSGWVSSFHVIGCKSL